MRLIFNDKLYELAREYNLTGKDNLEAAKADSIVDTWLSFFF